MGSRAESVEAWTRELEIVLEMNRIECVDGFKVLDEVASTQDAAFEAASGKPGIAVTALRQTGGRGRLGRTWADTASHGVAITFVLDGSRFDDATLSLAAGDAALITCVESLHQPRQAPRIGIRWPNDVVERDAPGRKLAGVLIERRGGLALVGIGVNVTQRDEDWPADLRGRAVSLHGLGGIHARRVDVAGLLAVHVDGALLQYPELVVERWREHNVLRGQQRAFEHDNRRYFGEVIDIDPVNAIRLRLSDGGEVSLPARTTSLVHE